MSTTSRRLRHSRWMIVVLVLLLTACVSNPFSGARPTSSPPASPTRLRTSPTALPSPAPSATTQIPTPLPTLGPDAFRIKAWTEQDAFDAILEGEKLDRSADAQRPPDIEGYLFTLEREALLRFPEGKFREEIEWRAAREAADVSHDTLEKDTPVGVFVRLLTKALNADEVKPDTLKAWLANKGFDVASRHPALNLFGDGELVEVLRIERRNWADSEGILIAISNSPRWGGYRLFPVIPYWSPFPWPTQTFENVSIVDHNGNERPEIQVLEESESPANCQSELSLYEWQGDNVRGHFENIAVQVNAMEGDYQNGECTDPWEFGARDARGAQPLAATLRYKNWAGDGCSEYEFKIRYEWNGTAYRRVSAGAVLPDKSQPRQCFVGWADAAAKHGLYDQAIPLVVSALADWPKELDNIWGPSAKDLFRLELGTWYAFQEDSDKAISTLQDVLDHPANPTFRMIPRVTETFLERYKVSKDPERACVTVYSLLKQEFVQTPDNGGFASSDRTIAAWGFGEPGWLSRVPRLDEVCNHVPRPNIPWNVQSPMPTPEAPLPTPEPRPTPSPELTQEIALQSIESKLFSDGDSQQASPLIEQLLAAGVIEPNYGTETVKPYLQYLLGLAYELSGNERNAVDAYWRLQQDYPNSLYSTMAQRKMQRVAP